MAGVVNAALAREGHRGIFLDFDPEEGIPAGRDWEKTLYSELRSCRAVIILCSAHSMASPWCFAEITHARALGKAVFPLKISACEIHPLLRSVQVTDLTIDPEQGFARLWRGLKAAGLDPADSFDWDGSRPPYPGLLAFDEKDAAIFFGRDKEIRDVLDTLSRQQRFGGARFALLLGASGSGKSSLLRAGVIPRLGRDPDHWVLVPPFRPLGRPFDNLAYAISAAFQDAGKANAPSGLCDRLAGDDAGAALVEIARELTLATRRTEATVLFSIDQLEELFTLSKPDAADRFFAALRGATEQTGSPVLVVATLRSDFLAAVQTHSILRDSSLVQVLVNPIALQAVGEIIEGPAAVAGLELEPGLTQAMVHDTEAEDALPLLAFTLRELWEHRNGPRLGLGVYRDLLGGLSGSVARAAEAVLASEATSTVSLEADLRSAFLSLVRVNNEGQFARRPAAWADLPASVHPILERFVSARLLVSDQRGTARTLEVAHEALFRSWDRLRAWLQENREFLLWRERLRGSLSEWEHSGRDEGGLLRGAVLTEAVNWTAQRPGQLAVDERAFIEASSELRERERHAAEAQRARELEQAQALAEEQRQRADQEARSGRKLRRLVYGLVVLVVGVAGALMFAWRATQAEAAARGLAIARQLATEAKSFLDLSAGRGADLRTSLLLASESLRSSWTAEGFEAWSAAMQTFPQRPKVVLGSEDGPFDEVTFSPDGSLLAVAGATQIFLLNGRSLERIAGLPAEKTKAVAFGFPDGRILASSDGVKIVIWDVQSRQPLRELAHDCRFVGSLVFDTSSRWLLSAGLDYHACVFDTATWTQIGRLNNDPTTSAAFLPGQTIVATGGTSLKVWKSPAAQEPEFAVASSPTLGALAFSDDGNWLATSGHLWKFDPTSDDFRLHPPQQIERWRWINGAASAVAFAPAGGMFAVAGNQTVQVRQADDKPQVNVKEILRMPIDGGELSSVSFGASTDWLLTAGENLTQWPLVSGSEHVRLQFDTTVEAVAVSPDPAANKIATTFGNGSIQVRETLQWRDIFNGEIQKTDSDAVPSVMAFSLSANWLAATSGKTLKVFSTADWRELTRSEHDDAVARIGFTADNRFLITVSRNQVRVTATDSWKSLVLSPVAGNGTIAVSPDGTMLAIRTDPYCQRAVLIKGQTRVWQIADGKPIATLPLGEEAMTGMSGQCHETSQSADAEQATGRVEVARESGKWPAAAASEPGNPTSRDGRFALRVNEFAGSASLEVVNGTHTIATMTHRGFLTGAVFTPDGRWLVTVSRDRTARVWALQTADLIDETCARVTRNLSRPEWQRVRGNDPYVPLCPALPVPDK
jgi:WD40 repeat protein